MDIYETINNKKGEIALKIYEHYRETNPRYRNDTFKEKTIQDVKYNLSYLATAIKYKEPAIFADYIDWFKQLSEGYGLNFDMFKDSLRYMAEISTDFYSREVTELIKKYVVDSLEIYKEIEESGFSHKYENQYKKYKEALLNTNKAKAWESINELMGNGVAIEDIYIHIFARAQYEIGQLWQKNKISIAQEHYATAVTQSLMSNLYAKLVSFKPGANTLVAVGTSGELHEIGIRMVADFFEMRGWNSVFFGSNTPSESVIHFIERNDVDLLAIGATLPPHLVEMQRLIDLARQTRPDLPIIVGGKAISGNIDLAKKLGADATAFSAKDAVRKGEEIV
ncbi:MAG: cobalamin B12-binding domain-containing protein [Elusimicrobiota bacterium]